MYDYIYRESLKRAKHKIWIFSDLQQSEPENAQKCLDVCMEDFYHMDKSADMIWFLGDCVEGTDITKLNKMCASLEEAFDANIDNLEVIFEKGIAGKLTGDINLDGKLNIRDATAIQKYLAEIGTIYDYGAPEFEKEYAKHIADFNHDGKITIRDVTAIQKRIAGVEQNNPDFDDFENDAYENNIRHANVTVNGKTYHLRSDEVMTIDVKLTCSKPISELDFDLKYNAYAIQTITKGSATDFLKTHCPNLPTDSELRTNHGYTYVKAPKGEYDFTEEKTLFTMNYTVSNNNDSDFEFILKSAFDKDGNRICHSSVPAEGTELTISYYVNIEKMAEK